MKRNAFSTGMLAIMLVFGLVVMGCPPEAEDPFESKTNNATANDVATLGFEGTAVSSSNTAKATAAIVSGKIAITSKGEGSATITVSVPYLTSATIPVTVNSDGDITIGTIVKVDTISDESSVYTFTASDSSDGLAVASAQKAGDTVLIKVSGTIVSANLGKTQWSSGAQDMTYVYGPFPGTGTGTAADYSLITIAAIADNVNSNFQYNFATLTALPLAKWYGCKYIQPGKVITNLATGAVRYTGTGGEAYEGDASAAADSYFPAAGGVFGFILYKGSKDTPITVQFDGPGGKDAPDGKKVVIDYSAVIWE